MLVASIVSQSYSSDLLLESKYLVISSVYRVLLSLKTCPLLLSYIITLNSDYDLMIGVYGHFVVVLVYTLNSDSSHCRRAAEIASVMSEARNSTEVLIRCMQTVAYFRSRFRLIFSMSTC